MKIVSIGGGTGQPVLLKGLKKITADITAIVGVHDSGGSSGRLRKELNVLPPGDIRNCLVALAKDEESLHKLFQYRFEEGPLKNHALGNLFLAALTKTTGSLEKAVGEAAKILNINGRVLPSTLQEGHICAELIDGSVVKPQHLVQKPGKPPIKRVFIEPEDVAATEESKKAILNADIIVLGPGSLFTSVIANLLIAGIPEAIKSSKATVVYVCNIFTQPGETDGYCAQDFVDQLETYLGKGVLDVVIMNNKMPSRKVLERYKDDGADFVTGDVSGVKVIESDVILGDESSIIWSQKNWVRHDPDKLAKIIKEL